MIEASADADRFGATERRVHKGRRLISSSRAEFPYRNLSRLRLSRDYLGFCNFLSLWFR